MKTGANVADTFHENIVDIANKNNIGSHHSHKKRIVWKHEPP